MNIVAQFSPAITWYPVPKHDPCMFCVEAGQVTSAVLSAEAVLEDVMRV
jgi:hypothetical protein